MFVVFVYANHLNKWLKLLMHIIPKHSNNIRTYLDPKNEN